MRLERVTLHRFGCFLDETIELAPGATLLLGSNNSGKSTLIEAIRTLFGDRDRFGTPYEWAKLLSRPAERAQGAWPPPPLPDDEIDLDDDPDDEAWVLGEFGDLTEEETQRWGPVTSDGRLRFGAIFGRSPEVSGRCLVIDETSEVGEAFANLLDNPPDDWDEWLHAPIEGEEQRADEAPADEAPADEAPMTIKFEFSGTFLPAGVRRRAGGQIWFSWKNMLVLWMTGWWPLPVPLPTSFPSERNIVTLPGPEAPLPSISQLLGDLLAEAALQRIAQVAPAAPPPSDPRQEVYEHISVGQGSSLELRPPALRALWDALAPLRMAAVDADVRVRGAFRAAMQAYTGATATTSSAGVWRLLMWQMSEHMDPGWQYTWWRDLLRSTIGELTVAVQPAALSPGEAVPRETPIGELGAGAQRLALLAAFELYRDPAIWPADRFALLLLEEPEVGLDPAAQRRVAALLRELPTYGVQMVVVSHSPIFIRSSDPAGWRIVRSRVGPDRAGRRWQEHEVMPANEPREIASTLDVRPSDVLLARRIIVVEGDSDRAAFLAWSDTLGASLSGAGVELVPSGGHGGAAQVSRLLDLVYAGTDVRVVLDNGPDTARSKLEIEARHGVPVQLLRRTEIEAYYSPDAVVGWLLRRGTLGSADETAVRSVFSEQPSKATLRTMASRYLNRTYDVVDDGRTIASLMLEREIPGEIKELIYAFVGE